MPNLSIDKLNRFAGRSEKIAESSTNASIQIAIQPLTEAKEAFKAINGEIKRLQTAFSGESKEAKEAKKNLEQKYDEVRAAFFSMVPYASLGEPASHYTTPDDLTDAATDIEDQLAKIGLINDENPIENGDEGIDKKKIWARILYRDLTPALETAEKEFGEAVEAGNDLQKAKNRRAEIRGGLDFQLRAFRKVVRKVFGSHSREYHSLRLVSLGKDDDENPTGGAPPA